MNKIKLPQVDKKSVDTFVEQIQSEFPKFEVTVDNVNDFSLMLEERKNCMNCKGLEYCLNSEIGHQMTYNNSSFVAVECKYKKAIRDSKKSLIKTLYLPKKILDASLENFDTNTDSRKKIFKHITDFTGNFGTDAFSKGLYLYGSFSIGKTYTLGVIASELAKKNISSLLIYFPDLVLDLKSALGTPRFEELVNMLKSIDVLMLDDIGSENMTPWLRDEILGPIINYRMLAQKTIYVTSNLTPQDLEKHLSIDSTPSSVLKGQRVVNRLTSMVYLLNMGDGTAYKR